MKPLWECKIASRSEELISTYFRSGKEEGKLNIRKDEGGLGAGQAVGSEAI